MTTLAAVLDRPGVEVVDALDVPVISGAQCQGDLIALPRPLAAPATTPVPPGGVDLVPDSHTLLSCDGPACRFDVRDPGPSGPVLGVLTVPVGATAYLVHSEEHGANAFGPGTYEIRRQRERADVVRRVAD
ncbi:hypothetical protein [Pseudonocardia humida]|uniref:Uncharacterized protein n=1 Tax=Pseudonocardia humida TaxID=2800819 RepID=A0ABT1AAQ4_9PSEU|nr:hypothetical protein [Pseudonocardia humida]MCO1660018.1 hypothetical protein [Pseudonocardia humida]